MKSLPSPPQAAPLAYDDAALDDTPASHDLTTYRAWLLQRGRSRPSLGLRRFDARSGLWQGWGLSYPSLQAVEYMGDRLLNLDFGTRQFVLEGRGLDELARRIKEGTVLIILEFAEQVWAKLPDGPVVTAIRCIGVDAD